MLPNMPAFQRRTKFEDVVIQRLFMAECMRDSRKNAFHTPKLENPNQLY